MADDRHFQIKERAGLDESRYNTEFIEFLRTWGVKIALVGALGMAAYTGYHWWQQKVAGQVSGAFDDLSDLNAGARPNPVALLEIAEKHDGVKSVGPLARIHAADAYMQAVRMRAAVGATFNPDGSLKDASGILTDELRDRYLNDAKTQYQRVYDATKADPNRFLLAISAGFGLAAVAESAGNFTDATTAYKEVVAICEANDDAYHAEIANIRLGNLDSFKQAPIVLSATDLPKPPPPPPVLPETFPLTPEAGGPIGPTPIAPSPISPAPATPENPAPATPAPANPIPAPSPAPSPAEQPPASTPK